MQIIIPMSGFGERFRRVGYEVPKPLIPVDGKPIIAHVIDMFPDETDFIFICNEDHIANPDYRMAQILKQYCPTARIVPIPAHRLGPVNAVLKAKEYIDLEAPTIVNYCDFTCYWDYKDFKNFVEETKCAGAIPAYKGFHPHSLGSTFYAYMQHDGLWMKDIQEKQPYTDVPINEYASSGTYYFQSGELCLQALEGQVAQKLDIGGEYYVSLAYQILLQKNLPIAIFSIQHFMQWGTPKDLHEYQRWSNTFRRLMNSASSFSRHMGAVLVPMAGLGSRFSKAGFDLPKPLIPVSGRAMVLQAVRDLPRATQYHFVTREDLPFMDEINQKLRSSFLDVSIKILKGPTEGQAITCLEGMDGIDLEAPLTIGACDNGMLYSPYKFEMLFEEGNADVIVWTVRGHSDGILRPEMFGWVDADEEGKIRKVSVKKPLENPAADPLITGAFTFRRAGDFVDAVNSLLKRDHRVNNEYYVDSIVDDLVKSGLDCRIFDVDSYIGWGTPTDLATFEYWQSCFHKWESHPYRLEKDADIPPSALQSLNEQYAHIQAPRPEGVKSENSLSLKQDSRLSDTKGELLRFIPVGVVSVCVDFLVYFLSLALGAGTIPAKAFGTIVATFFSFFGNRHFAFKKSTKGRKGIIVFLIIYSATLLINVATNQFMLYLLNLEISGRYVIAFCVATAIAASINFIGMKMLVFTELRKTM